MEDRGENGKREKVKYNVLLVPDKATETVKQLSINLQMIKTFLLAAALLVVVGLLYCLILTKELDKAKSDMVVLQVEIETLTKQNELLISQKVEQNETITKLNDTLNDKVQQEELREAELAKAYIPSGFPVKGTVSYNETETEWEGNPAALFHAAQGTSVTATARGTVSSIENNGVAGYIVTVDHGNGYQTLYRNGAQPKVKEGTEVTDETELFEIEAGYEELCYQIMENDKYIDPLSLMEIQG